MEIHLSEREFSSLGKKPWILRPKEVGEGKEGEVEVFVGLRRAGKARVEERRVFASHSELPGEILSATETPRPAVAGGPLVAIRLGGFEPSGPPPRPSPSPPPPCPVCGGELSPGVPLWRCGTCGFAFAVEEGGLVGPIPAPHGQAAAVGAAEDELRRKIEEQTGVKFTDEGWAWVREHAEEALRRLGGRRPGKA
jgi:hypothetical protein